MIKKPVLYIVTLILISFYGLPLATHAKDAAEILLDIEKLNVLGSVLYIGAHPDDENTGLISYLAMGRKFRTAYLSLTRGDGGQNLIGKEKGDEIGIIRTQELLQARNIDGGEQFFTRAIDFGYSKSAEESFNLWGKESILSDVVWVIRQFRPDVIITRFPPDGNGGHGHHTASAILAKEAFYAAADPKSFSEQLKFVQPWQAKRLFWNSWRPGQETVKELIGFDIGSYNSLLGKSYTEIAAESRSMHKSQGFGASASRGSRMEYFQFILGEPVNSDLFENIDYSWNRLPGGENITIQIRDILQSLNIQNPAASTGKLLNLYKNLNKMEKTHWVVIKIKELLNIISACTGVWMEAVSDNYFLSPGERINIKTTIVKRSETDIILEKIEFPSLGTDTLIQKNLEKNTPLNIEANAILPGSYQISQPYWLAEDHQENLFNISDQEQIGLAENGAAVPVKVLLKSGGVVLDYIIPLFYKWNDRIEGELSRPYEIRPPVTFKINDRLAVFTNEKNEKEISVRLLNNSANAEGEVHLHTENGWKVTPDVIPFSLKNRYDELPLTFTITAPSNADISDLRLEINTGNNKYNYAQVEIQYPHINQQIYFPESKIKLLKLDVEKSGNNIAYIEGSGDEIPDCLRNLGYSVTILSDEDLENSDLSDFDAIIAGIRVYNTRERSNFFHKKLLDYIYNGGTYIMQYNVSSGLKVSNLGPYPFTTGNERVSVEEAAVNLINPGHQLLNYPNKISLKDFEGWVQERGLYFASQWDSKYETVIASGDPGEKELNGGLLFTRYGKGIFIYSGYSWFRQLPAGVPGAYRIFVNMISAGKFNEKLTN